MPVTGSPFSCLLTLQLAAVHAFVEIEQLIERIAPGSHTGTNVSEEIGKGALLEQNARVRLPIQAHAPDG
jgi:hypothetical protein